MGFDLSDSTDLQMLWTWMQADWYGWYMQVAHVLAMNTN